MLAIIFVVLCSFVAVYLYNKRHYSKWEKLNVPGPKPSYIFGNMKDATLMRKAISEVYADIYHAFSNVSYVGTYLLRRPAILVRDPNILKDILVKDFYNFHDNDMDIEKTIDPIFGNNPFTVKGEAWKIVRSQHTPHFTTSKNKIMYPMVEEVGNRVVRFLNDEIRSNGGSYCIEALELSARFTTDSVALCSLGIDAKSFETAELRNVNKTIFNPDFVTSIKLFLLFILPSFAKYLSVRLISKAVYATYKGLVVETLRYRKENNVIRNDFFDAIKERKGRESTLVEMTTQVGGFFIDGFGTSSSGVSFMLYAVAAHEDVQNKLRTEIDRVLQKYEGNLTLDAVQEMTYLDAVMAESLRLYPPLPQLTKRCTKPYTLPPASDTSPTLNVDVGTVIVVPLMGLHYDEKYYPNAHKFDPDRFSKENKELIPKYAYLPFGEGPRVCLGMRFAQMQAKILLAKLISNFEMRINSRTKTPIEFDPQGILLGPLGGGMWIDYYKRK